jgi:hypothetical protein
MPPCPAAPGAQGCPAPGVSARGHSTPTSAHARCVGGIWARQRLQPWLQPCCILQQSLLYTFECDSSCFKLHHSNFMACGCVVWQQLMPFNTTETDPLVIMHSGGVWGQCFLNVVCACMPCAAVYACHVTWMAHVHSFTHAMTNCVCMRCANDSGLPCILQVSHCQKIVLKSTRPAAAGSSQAAAAQVGREGVVMSNAVIQPVLSPGSIRTRPVQPAVQTPRDSA